MIGRGGLFGVLAGAGVGGLGVRRLLQRGLPLTEGELRVRGLDAEVQIHRDRWGVPHVVACTNADLFFAQGLVHAQDRLWQMELHRRLPQGLLAEVFGERVLELDRFFRRLGLHRVARTQVERASPEAREALEAYARGVNAWLEHDGSRLPPEFLLTRLEPRPWTALDSVSFGRYIGWILSDNWISELIRSRFIARLGVDEAWKLEPGVWSAGELDGEKESLREGAKEYLSCSPSLLLSFAPAPGSSNAWAVSGGKSVSGRPLLGSDPHLPPGLPALWYEVHLRGGDYHVAGASLPGLPGVAIGHNERIAWGATVASVDVQDLYVERLDPQQPGRYKYRGGWEQAEIVPETIRVRGRAEPMVEQVLVTRHGPLLTPSAVLPGEERALALRSAALERSSHGLVILLLNRAGSWDEFRRALEHWQAPQLNFIYADVDGNVGQQLAARVPVRARGLGLVPAPGWTGEHEWSGWVPFDELPSRFNPSQGYVASGNNDPREAGYRHHLSREWIDPFRHQRICEFLEARPRLGADDFRDLQMDRLCLPGKKTAEHLCSMGLDGAGDAEAGGPNQGSGSLEVWALRTLSEWDGVLGPDSVAGALYEVFKARFLALRFGAALGELLPHLLGQGLHPVVAPTSTYGARATGLLLHTLQSHGGEAATRAQVRMALRETIELLQRRLGPDPQRWQWGRLHRLTLRHSLGQFRPLDALFRLGPFPLGGDADTPFQAAWKAPSLQANSWCPSLRLICDLANWDDSLAVLPPGQSGHRLSPHYADQVKLWLTGNYHPMPFSARAVAAHSRAALRLAPERET